MRFLIFLFLISSSINIGNLSTRVHLSSNKKQPGPILKNEMPFPIGAAISTYHLQNNSTYRNLIEEQFNSITAENAMKFAKLHPSEKEFKWEEADKLVSFAKKNKIRVHGHTLLWAAKNPLWVSNFQGDRDAWKKMLKNHIHTIVTHFKGDVESWDVVNEAFTETGTLKKSIWLEKLGKEYISLAFQYAHEADPAAKLFYNDYGHEYGGKKLRAIMDMVADFKRRNIPIHGLGLQMHLVLRIPDKNIQYGINAAAKSGLLIHISELEISVKYKMPKTFLLNTELEKQQALKYKTVFLAYAMIPKRQQFGITTWNVGDRDAFRNSVRKNRDHPNIFNDQYQPKRAFNTIVDSMRAMRSNR